MTWSKRHTMLTTILLKIDRVWGLVETLYPGNRGGIEEQNIHYVMVTRAKKEFVNVTGIC